MRAGSALLLFAALAGCGSPKPDVVPAGGKVTYRKTTVPAGALVVFHPADPETEKRIGGKPFAKVGDDGTFRLTTYAEGDGAPPGDYGVTIDWRGTEKGAKFSLGSEGGGGAPKLNPKYSTPSAPAFKITVKKGDSNEFAFDVD